MAESQISFTKPLADRISEAEARNAVSKNPKVGSSGPLRNVTNLPKPASVPMAIEKTATAPPSILADLQSPKEHLSHYPKDMDVSLSKKTEDKEEQASRTAINKAGPKRIGGDSFVLDQPLVEYLDDVDAALRQNELKYRPRPDYTTKVQKDITSTMRSILVAWLVEVAEEYTLSSQTLFLTVAYIDRLLSEVSVHRSKLQLVGITSMLMAAKYEEIYPPSVDEFVYITDHTYTRNEVIQMETVILGTLNFALTNVTPWEFVRRYTKIGQFDAKSAALSQYLPEIFMHETDSFRHIPSQIAAAACAIAYWTVHGEMWRGLKKITSHTRESLQPVVVKLQRCHRKTFAEDSGLQAARTKFSEEKWFKVATLPAQQAEMPLC